MNKVKVITLLLVILLVFYLFFYYAFPDRNSDINYDVTEIFSKEINGKLFIKKKVWGITSDNQVIVVSDSDQRPFFPDSKQDYVYEGVMPFFYKVNKDTLSIYSFKVSPIPKNIKTNFIIKQVHLENKEIMKLLDNDNYKSKGLMIIN